MVKDHFALSVGIGDEVLLRCCVGLGALINLLAMQFKQSVYDVAERWQSRTSLLPPKIRIRVVRLHGMNFLQLFFLFR